VQHQRRLDRERPPPAPLGLDQDARGRTIGVGMDGAQAQRRKLARAQLGAQLGGTRRRQDG